MSKSLSFALCCFLGFVAGASQGRAESCSYELDTNYSFVGGAHTNFSDFKGVRNGDVSEQSGLFRFVASPQLTESVLLRLGTEWQRYAFGLPEAAPFPTTLQSTSLVVGADIQAFGSWLFRVETLPGFYSASDRIDGSDINVPFVLGATYIAGPDLQWSFGCMVDPYSRLPFLPGVSVRWKFAEKWVLNAILPTPRLEYSYSKSITFYSGLDIKLGTYRLDGDFAADHHVPCLKGWVDYTELRAGAGVSWKLSSSLKLELESGYMPYRDLDYHHNDFRPETYNGAPYGQISLGGRF